MPTEFKSKGIKFYFWSNEGAEPIHIHFEKGDSHGKYWIEPECELNYYFGFSNAEINFIEK